MAAVKLSWKRPVNIEYPRTWFTFEERDLNSNELVQYQIRDLTIDRFDEAFNLIATDFLRNEPTNQALKCADDPGIVARRRAMCLTSLDQKTALACFKASTDEIVGVNLVMVHSKSDNIAEQTKDFPQADNEKITHDVISTLYEDFDVYEHYGVDKLLTCCGLSVAEKYRGRGIGLKLLETRAQLAKAFDIKIGHSDFTSKYSIAIAEKAGFKLDRAITFKELYNRDPRFYFGDIQHEKITIMTWVFSE